ncbi:MAG: chitooligosaccharide deacetylase [Xanthobacteraceae bacterium]|nr:MAG: chitooligosaccharide deacetylase [Xanthobacteraceae bacterium]
MLPTERIAYSAISQRPKLTLPGGKRLAVWLIVNVEEWNPKETMPRTVLTPPAGGCRTFRTGPGTNTATASASGGC